MILIQNYSLRDFLKLSNTAIEQISANEGEIVTQISSPGIYLDERSYKMVAIVKSNILTELKAVDNDLEYDMMIADKTIGKKELKKKEKEQINKLVELLDKSHENIRKMLKKIPNIKKVNFNGTTFIIPDDEDIQDIIKILKKSVVGNKLLYYLGIAKAKQFLQFYRPLADMSLSSHFKDSDIKKAYNLVRHKTFQRIRSVDIRDIGKLYEVLNNDLSRS